LLGTPLILASGFHKSAIWTEHYLSGQFEVCLSPQSIILALTDGIICQLLVTCGAITHVIFRLDIPVMLINVDKAI
jgi:hypothetical protein